MDDFPYLTTHRLILREMTAGDAPALFAILSDADAMRWFGSDPLSTLEQAEKLVETFAAWRQMPNPGTRWGIHSRKNDRLLGSCGLFKWNRTWRSCVVGYELAPSAWGQGFMTEALSAVLDWGFEAMALNRIEAQVHPKNTASIMLLRKLGFLEEGHLREAGFWSGAHHDLKQFALLRNDRVELSVREPTLPLKPGKLG